MTSPPLRYFWITIFGSGTALTGSNNPEIEDCCGRCDRDILFAVEFVDDRRRRQPLAGIEVPEVLSGLGVQRHYVTIVVSRKHDAARIGDRAGPHAADPGHRILPGALARLRVERSQETWPPSSVAPPPAKFFIGTGFCDELVYMPHCSSVMTYSSPVPGLYV